MTPLWLKRRWIFWAECTGELGQLAADRRARLDDSRRLWQFLWELGEEAAWIREQEQILSGGDYGKDLSSALHLLSKHEAFRDEMAARYGPLSNSIAGGETLVKEGHFGAPEVTERIKEVGAQWSHLEEVKDQTLKWSVSLSTASQSYSTCHTFFFYRPHSCTEQGLKESVAFHQFQTDANDMEAWILETLRLVKQTHKYRFN